MIVQLIYNSLRYAKNLKKILNSSNATTTTTGTTKTALSATTMS